jgi:uncharacterized protein YifN (PemK superfamily)
VSKAYDDQSHNCGVIVIISPMKQRNNFDLVKKAIGPNVIPMKQYYDKVSHGVFIDRARNMSRVRLNQFIGGNMKPSLEKSRFGIYDEIKTC